MPKTPVEIVRELLAGATKPEVVHALVAPDATYVSLNYENAELQQIMPWAGTARGPEAILSTYTRVGEFWENEAFAVETIFGDGENVAVFGRFTYRSKTLGKSITSPFSILAKVNDSKVTYMQFMEDTFGTASTFRSGGTWKFRSNPAGGEIEV